MKWKVVVRFVDMVDNVEHHCLDVPFHNMLIRDKLRHLHRILRKCPAHMENRIYWTIECRSTLDYRGAASIDHEAMEPNCEKIYMSQ